ncbi:MAG TPA: sigma-70 family RNA polymerase sigma factor [Solirubrobacteraceae bacterium]
MTLLDADTAFTALYTEHRDSVWKLAAFKLSDRHEAEDALQETFLRAYRSRGRFRRAGAERAWLLTICRNVCLDRLRSRAAHPTAPLDFELAGHAVDMDGQIDLRAGLAALPADDLEAFFLVDVLGLASHEAAAVLGVRASSTLRSRVARARVDLEAALAVPALDRAEVWGVFHAPPDRAIVVARSPAPPGHLHVPDVAMASFFESVEARVPESEPLTAIVVSERDGSGWVADHPRWQLRAAGSRETWLRDAERLLAGHDRALALVRAAKRFVWTAGP